MTTSGRFIRTALCATAMWAAGWAAAADFEVTGPDGRRILLKDDKTWRYVEPDAAKDPKRADGGKETAATPKDASDKNDAAAEKKDAVAEKKDAGEAVLFLDSKMDGNRVCRLQVRLVNNLRYEIRSLVPEFSIFRANDVVYDSVFAGFGFVKPGDSQRREVRFNGIDCADIARVRVGGGDRCEMGDLDKFANAKGKCLSHVRVEASNVMRFDK